MTKYILVGVFLHHLIFTSVGQHYPSRHWALDVLDNEIDDYANLEILNIGSNLGLLGIMNILV